MEALGGMLAGVTVTGVLLAIFQSNAGGAWDNAKKSFEEGVSIKGITYYKKSEPHKAAIVGDTVGDPFKDTSGPSLNILLKLMSVVALVLAPFLVKDVATPIEKIKEKETGTKVENVKRLSSVLLPGLHEQASVLTAQSFLAFAQMHALNSHLDELQNIDANHYIDCLETFFNTMRKCRN